MTTAPYWQCSHAYTTMDLYMIHKIEIYPHYTYPTVNAATTSPTTFTLGHQTKTEAGARESLLLKSTKAQDKLSLDGEQISSHLAPYRTVSHYGFNYPSTYMPTVNLQPVCSMSAVDLQRQKVIAFIKRLNLEAQGATDNHLDSSAAKLIETGKEDPQQHHHIYENTKELQKTESFISVKEIQLNKTRKQRNISTSSSSHVKNTEQHSQTAQGDLMSEQFSSLLSISGTYPAASHSHTGDQEHDHFTTDSGDNCSNFDNMAHKTPQDNLYRSYLQRHFVTTNTTTDTDHSNDLHEHDPHKPECEQQSHMTPPLPHHRHKVQASSDNRHVTLTLNSLKRRASSLCERKDKSNSRSRSITTKMMTAGHSAEDSTQSSTGSSSSTAIEIHINVNIRNSDCVKNLQNHEYEFKSKLEKVIDNEINMITKELETQENSAVAVAAAAACHQNEEDSCEEALGFHLMKPHQRCLSAPDALGTLHNGQEATTSSSCIEADRQYHYDSFNSVASTPLPPPAASSIVQQDKINLSTVRYRHTLALLEHELEMLLNGIIRNMCDCKTKISQMSEEIRTATLHVGSLSVAKDKQRHYHHHQHYNHQRRVSSGHE